MTDMAGKRVLMIQAHPDDCEFGSAGTVARWISEGAEVHYCSITSGDNGSNDPELLGAKLATLREAEQREAARILGVSSVVFLGYKDGSVVADLQLRRALVRVIRQIRPNALMVLDPTFRYMKNYLNHPDHVAAGEAAMAAAFPAAGSHGSFPELLDEGLLPHDPTDIYVMLSPGDDTWIDVSDFMDIKLKALNAHASQMRNGDPSDMVREWARATAARHPNKPEGFGEFAESFFHIQLGG
ncbi:MAG: PIG-L deacetylase family protein [Thermomicrobiales bacterium]